VTSVICRWVDRRTPPPMLRLLHACFFCNSRGCGVVCLEQYTLAANNCPVHPTDTIPRCCLIQPPGMAIWGASRPRQRSVGTDETGVATRANLSAPKAPRRRPRRASAVGRSTVWRTLGRLIVMVWMIPSCDKVTWTAACQLACVRGGGA